jgi:RimJ/RimL family protein N-acetyltransferase
VLIETERLFLRPWGKGDAEEAKWVYCDPEVRFFTGGAIDPERMNEFIRCRMADYVTGRLRLLPLIEKTSTKIVGSCGLQPFDGGPHIEIIWMLAREARRKGYATEMARAVLFHGLNVMKLRRIIAAIDPRNYRSVAVANRLDMKFSEVSYVYGRDMLCYEARL